MGIFSECKTTTDQGNIGLSKAIYELQRLGYRISVPLTENQDYDLIGDKDNKLNRIQVRTTKYTTKYGIYMANLRVMGGNQSFHTIKKRTKGKYEFLYTLTDNNDSYLIPDDKINVENSLALGKKMEEFKINI